MKNVLLPHGWVESSLSSVAKLIFGQSPPSETYNDTGHGLPFFQGKAEFGPFHPQVVKWCTEPTRQAETGDILISVRAPVGPTNIAIETCAIGRGLAAIRPIIVERDFIRYYLKLTESELASKGTGTTFKAITKDVLQNNPIIIAPLNEQKRIVDKIEQLFSNLDEGESLLKKVQQQLNVYRQSVLKAAVTGELTKDWREANKHRLESGDVLLKRILKARREQWNGRGQYKEPVAPDTSNLPELPDGWVWVSPDQIALLFGNGLSKKPANYETKFPILRISAVRPMLVNTKDIRHYDPSDNEKLDSYWVQRGDLLFTRYNGSGHLVGVCGLYKHSTPVLHPDKLIKLRIVSFGNDHTNNFIEICLNTGESRRFIKSNIKTTAGQQGIAGSDLKSTPIPFAPFAEQLVIVGIVDSILSQIAALEQWCASELTRSATLRQSILKDAFSGKLVQQDPNDEPASELLKRIQAERSVTQKAPKQKSSTTTSTRRGRPRKNS